MFSGGACRFQRDDAKFRTHKGYFEGTRQTYLPDVYPPFLFREAAGKSRRDACEGSMLQEQVANALTTDDDSVRWAGFAENKVSLGYGGEACHMDAIIQSMCERYVRLDW